MKDEINIDGVVYVKKEIMKDKEWHRKNSEGFLEDDSGDWKYVDNKYIHHLMRDGKEIAKGKWVYSYPNGDWKYKDYEDVWHLMRGGKEIARGRAVYSFPNGDWAYMDDEGTHICRIIDNYVWERKNKI